MEGPEEDLMRKLIFLIGLAVLLSACTLSFTNIDTHGPSHGVLEQDLKNDPTTTVPVLHFPVVPGA